jgi:hypothetical protein
MTVACMYDTLLLPAKLVPIAHAMPTSRTTEMRIEASTLEVYLCTMNKVCVCEVG